MKNDRGFENARLIFRDAEAEYRLNGWIDTSEFFSGEFVYPSIRCGICLQLCLSQGTYEALLRIFEANHNESSAWVYQLVVDVNDKRQHWVVGDDETVTRINVLTASLHQLALIQKAAFEHSVGNDC